MTKYTFRYAIKGPFVRIADYMLKTDSVFDADTSVLDIKRKPVVRVDDGKFEAQRKYTVTNINAPAGITIKVKQTVATNQRMQTVQTTSNSSFLNLFYVKDSTVIAPKLDAANKPLADDWVVTQIVDVSDNITKDSIKRMMTLNLTALQAAVVA
jgi:hypothetical protein